MKGSFSRYDFQRNPNSGVASVKSYKTLLPAAARDAYYRDEIGNISTSHLREDEDFVELELRPRWAPFRVHTTVGLGFSDFFASETLQKGYHWKGRTV